jgi:hypothetical protein
MIERPRSRSTAPDAQLIDQQDDRLEHVDVGRQAIRMATGASSSISIIGSVALAARWSVVC